MNSYYRYSNFELWDNEKWKGRGSPVDGLARWLGEHVPMNETVYTHRPCPEPLCDPDYRPKTLSVDDHEVIGAWAEKGIRMTVLSQGGKRWVSMVPEQAMAKRSKNKLPALVVFHREHYQDPWWAMRTVDFYHTYNEMLAQRKDFMIVYLVTEGADTDGIYLNILQEAFVLYPTDLDQIYFDVHCVLEQGVSLKDLLSSADTDRQEGAADLAERLVQFPGLELPVLNVSGRWGHRDSLGRNLVMNYGVNEGIFDRDRMLHSATGKKMAESLRMEYDYADVSQPGFADYWQERGLIFQVHTTKGQRWMTLVPKSAEEEPAERLPLMLVVQEVYPGNEHLAVSAFSYLYELTDIAAQGECMLLFFALEDPESNELLLQLIREMQTSYPVDPTRVYITGHSHDGGFARIFAYRHPERIAGLATLGNGVGLASVAETGNPVGGTEDADVERLRQIELPVINIGGEKEFAQPTSHDEFKQFVRGWQRRLAIARCQPVTEEEVAIAMESGNLVERKLGVPVDEGRVLWLDGFEHYIGDYINEDGKRWLRMVRIDNMPHTVTASMLTMAWSFLRRFARDPQSGKIIERY
jgi:pimeloyl-ACP methyl ester carboxylesterase